MAKAKQNELIRCEFEVYDASDQPLTGQVGNVVTRLVYNGAVASESVTVSEINSTGQYEATFTPLSLGTYSLTIDKTGISTDTRIEHGGRWEVEVSDLDDIITEIDANETKLDIIDGVVDSILLDTNEIQGKLPTNDIADQTLIDADLTNIETDTQDIQSKIGSPPINLYTDLKSEIDANETKIDALALEANVEAHVINSLNTYDPPTRAEATADKNEILLAVSNIETLMLRLLGLSQENSRRTGYSWQANAANNGYLCTGLTMKAYGNAADAENDVNPTDTWVMTASYDSSDRMDEYLIKRVI